MKPYVISIISNTILGMFSLNPLIYGIISINGGISIFGPSPKPSTQELIAGWLVCLAVLLTIIVVNMLLYKKFRTTIKRPKILFVIGILFYISGLFSFTVGIYAPDIFNIM